VTELVLPRSSLGQLTFLASGGTAKVFRVQTSILADMSEVVYKEYNKKAIEHAGPGLGPGLHAIVDARDQLPEPQRNLIDDRTLWPLRIIQNEKGNIVGVLMRLIPDRYFQQLELPSGATKTQPRELQLLFMEDDEARARGMQLVPIRTRIEICGQIARSLGLLHKAHVVYGDVSARNVIYDTGTTSKPETVLVDCDSVRIAGTRSAFGSQPHTPMWEPPESQNAKRRLAIARRGGSASVSQIQSLKQSMMTQSTPTDVYKFGLMVVRVLDYGRGRSPNRNPNRAASVLQRFGGPDLAALLCHSLSDDPHDRPTMREWFDAMSGGSTKTQKVEPKPAPQLPGQVVGSWEWIEGQGWIRKTVQPAT
jgi:serine/threonine protein kinase